jgi:hypothetical protein
MWAINEIVESDFVANMYDQKDYDILVTKRNDKLVVHKKYFLVFQHDLQPGYTEKQFISNKEKYDRRSKRFIELLKKNTHILFFKLEQFVSDVLYARWKEYEKDELQYIIDFSTIIKTKYPHLIFACIYINTKHETQYLCDSNVIILKADFDIDYDEPTEKTIRWENCVMLIKKIIDDNYGFIVKCLNKKNIGYLDYKYD